MTEEAGVYDPSAESPPPTGRGPVPPRRDYVVQGLTIVVGILAALLVDAGWDWLVDRREEGEYLASLRTELIEAREELDADQAARDEIVDHTRRLLEAAEDPAAVPADSLALWTSNAIDFRFFTPPSSVLDDLIQSGSLGLIRSDSLRFDLLRYVQEWDRIEVAEERERAFVFDRLEPALAAAVGLADLLPPDGAADRWVPDPEQVARLRVALEDPELRSLLYLRLERTSLVRTWGIGLGRIIDRAVARIEAEL